MGFVKLDMAITSKIVIDVVPICDLRNEWTWVFSKWIKSQSIDNDANGLAP